MKQTVGILLPLILVGQLAFSQVGIGVEPQELTDEMLQIKGEFIVTEKVGQRTALAPLEEFKVVNGLPVTTEYRVVAIDPNVQTLNGQAVKGQVKEMYDQQNVLPIIIQPYSVKNILGDDLTSLNLQIPTDEYYVAITNFEAVDNLAQGFGTGNEKGRFEYYVFEDNGFWHVKIGNPHISPATLNNAFDYNFDVLIYPNRFFKDLGEVVYENVGQNGAADEAAVD